MKIGILTMNYRCNYGGILQCLALRRIIEELGHEVEVIRFLALDEKQFIRKIKLLTTGISFSMFIKYIYDKLADYIKLNMGFQRPLSDSLLKNANYLLMKILNIQKFAMRVQLVNLFKILIWMLL